MTSLVKESLAIILDSSLSMEPVPRDLFGKKKSFFLLQHLSKISHCLSTDATTKLVVYLSISHLDYCNFLFVDLPVATFHALQSLQNTGAPGARPFMSPPSPTFSLDCLPITNHISLKLNCLCYKGLHYWLLIAHLSCLMCLIPSCPFHSAAETHWLHTLCTMSGGQQTLTSIDPSTGNTQPSPLHHDAFLRGFKWLLKIHCFKTFHCLKLFHGISSFANPIYTLT